MNANKILMFLSGTACDSAPVDGNEVSRKDCNCGKDHGSDDKNVAPSVVTGEEDAKDAAKKKYLAMCD